ncbi:MAG: hypothetical protein MUO78_03950, partial [candidate division Zixibacteria bacterium]|nr:hypothetical protein [candidate division Zixibacteria bacterium]
APKYHIYPFLLEGQKVACAPQHKKLEMRLIQGVLSIKKFPFNDVERKKGFRPGQESKVDSVYTEQISSSRVMLARSRGESLELCLGRIPMSTSEEDARLSTLPFFITAAISRARLPKA